jgi:hypothetical protein
LLFFAASDEPVASTIVAAAIPARESSATILATKFDTATPERFGL